MNVLALVTDGFGGHGGIARYNQDLLAALSASDKVERILVLPRRAPPHHVHLPANVHQAPAVGGRLGYAASAARAARRQGPFDLLFCGHLYMSPLAAGLAARMRIPLWLQVHGVDAWTPPGPLIRRAVGRAALITSVSRYTRRRFLTWADLPPERVRILPNTVSPAIAPGPPSTDLAQSLEVAGRKVLLTVSRLDARERYKGVDRVLAVLPRVLARHPGCVYVVVGDGDDRARLSELAESLGLAPSVRFVGQASDRTLADYYRLANVFVMPSTGEGFGIVFLEAAAAGVPLVGGNRDGSVDPLGDGDLGTLVDPLSSDELAAAIIHVLDSGKTPVPEALARFSPRNFAAHLGTLLEPLAT